MRPRLFRSFARPHAGLFLFVRASPPYASPQLPDLYIFHVSVSRVHKRILFIPKRVTEKKMQMLRVKKTAKRVVIKIENSWERKTAILKLSVWSIHMLFKSYCLQRYVSQERRLPQPVRPAVREKSVFSICVIYVTLQVFFSLFLSPFNTEFLSEYTCFILSVLFPKLRKTDMKMDENRSSFSCMFLVLCAFKIKRREEEKIRSAERCNWPKDFFSSRE